MPATTVTVTLECAGNGRAFFDPPVAGIQWRKGAVGTCTWTGVRVADLLKRAGARPAATHLWVSGADRPLGTQPAFVRQVPMAKAMDPGTIVAYAMNGQPIPAAHGFPLRLVVPGWEGAYAIKWLNKITLATAEHDGFWVATGYRYPTKRVAPGAAVDAKDLAPLDRTGREVAHHPAARRRGDAAGQASRSPASPGPARSTSRASTSRWTPAPRGSRHTLAGKPERFAWRRFEFAFDATQAGQPTPSCRAPPTRRARRSRSSRSGIRRATCGTRPIRCGSR